MPSPHSKRAYDLAIKDFLSWCRSSEVPDFTKATLQEYRSVLEARALSASTINLRICAIRKLAVELADNGAMPQDVADTSPPRQAGTGTISASNPIANADVSLA